MSPGWPATAGPKSLPMWWKSDVEHDRGQAAQGDAAAEDDLGPARDGLRDLRLRGHEHRQADAGRHDHHVAVVVEVDLGQGLEADDGHGGEHRDRGAAEHGVRDAGDDRAGLGDQAEQHHDHAGGRDDVAALHAGQPDQADVLGEAGVGEGVEDAAEGGGQAVGAQGAGDVLAADPLLDDLAGGEDVTGGLDRRDQHDDDHRDDGGEGELRPAEVERRGGADPAGAADRAEVGVAERPGDGGPDDQADEHGDRGHEALEDALDGDDQEEGAEGVGEVLAAGRVRGRARRRRWRRRPRPAAAPGR